eukprot:XP_002532555.2 uncharacterized protein LOC8279837 [Ricinus communis]
MDQQDMEDNGAAKRPEHERPPAPAGPYPWLVYCHGKGREDQTFWTISDPKRTALRRIPELDSKICWASSHGWCFFSDRARRHFFLWNPLTLEKIDLPDLQVYNIISSGYISSSPRETGCKILLFVGDHPSIMFLELGDKEWTEIDYSFLQTGKVVEYDHILRDPVYCNGKLYVFSYLTNSAIFVLDEINKGGVVLRSLNVEYQNIMSQLESLNFRRCFVEASGEIYGINILLGGYDSRVVDIEVRKIDFSRMAWEKVECVKDSVLFLDDHYSISCPEIRPEIQGNRLYFVLKDHKLYSYSIEDRSISLVSPYLPEDPFLSFWVMPDLRDYAGSRNREEIDACGEKQEIHQEAYFHRLPSDVITSLIIKRLNLVHYLNLRTTCSLFRSLAPPIQQKLCLQNHSSSPRLMFFEKDNICTFFEPKNSDKCYLHLPQQLAGCQICYSKDGWFMMSRGKNFFYCFNPLTGEILKFTDTTSVLELELICVGFSTSPTSSDCIAVTISKLNNLIEIYFAFRGDTKWVLEQIDDDTDFTFGGNSPVFYNGVFYYLGEKGNLAILEIIDDMVTWEVLWDLKSPRSHCHQNFLVECDGNLLSVFVGEFEGSVEVFRLSQSKMVWIRVENLGNYMVCVSRSSSFSSLAKAPGMENKIFFPRFYGENIVFYSLDTNKFHSFDRQKIPIEFYISREQLRCGWFEPRWY